MTIDPAGGPKIKSILVKWSLYSVPLAPCPSTATGILVQRSVLGGPWQDLTVLPLGATQFNDLTVQPGMDDSYRLQVLDASGNDSDFANTPDAHNYPNLPSTPTISAVTASGATSLHITWSNTLTAADAEVNSYRLERAAAAGGPYSAVDTLPQAAASYEDSGLTANTPYFYRLFATNSSGDSAPSAEVSGTTRSLTLAAPQNLALANPSAAELPAELERGTGSSRRAGGDRAAGRRPAGLHPDRQRAGGGSLQLPAGQPGLLPVQGQVRGRNGRIAVHRHDVCNQHRQLHPHGRQPDLLATGEKVRNSKGCFFVMRKHHEKTPKMVFCPFPPTSAPGLMVFLLVFLAK